ncbi:MAG: DUF3450 family protein [Pseudomonadota bacterium]|nr:DUF3450 family protein [Pseudomonadota bacterium]
MTRALLVFFASALLSSAWAEAPADSRAEALARLRREVETLSTELGEEKEDARGRLRAIEAQKVEIEVQIRREELRLAQVAGEAEARRAELTSHATRGADLALAVQAAIARMRAVVAAGLPFHLPDRLAEMDTLSSQLATASLTPEAAAARLWAFTEDELRLARENGLDRQVVSVDGAEVLADVARLGMVALYFRTEGGVVGMVTRGGGGWQWTRLEDREDEKAVGVLFDKLKHGVRTGAFTLPNPYAGGAP